MTTDTQPEPERSAAERERLEALCLLGPHGDPDAQALWLALMPCVAAAHELLGIGAVFGLPEAGRMKAQLYDTTKDTPLTGARCIASRSTFIESYVEKKSHGRSMLTSITVDGVQHNSPIVEAATEEYRRYIFGRATLDLDRARGVLGVLRRLLLASEPTNFRYARSERGAAPAVLATAQEVRMQLYEGLLRVEHPFLTLAKRVQRMNTVERLGRKL